MRDRVPNRDSREEASRTATGSRSTPSTNPTPASRRASAWPPAPTVASTTTAFPDRSSTTLETRTGRWPLAKHPYRQQPQPRVAGQDGGHQSHQEEALTGLRHEWFLHRCSPPSTLVPALIPRPG